MTHIMGLDRGEKGANESLIQEPVLLIIKVSQGHSGLEKLSEGGAPNNKRIFEKVSKKLRYNKLKGKFSNI